MRFKMHISLHSEVWWFQYRKCTLTYLVNCWPLSIFHFLIPLYFLYIFRMHCINCTECVCLCACVCTVRMQMISMNEKIILDLHSIFPNREWKQEAQYGSPNERQTRREENLEQKWAKMPEMNLSTFDMHKFAHSFHWFIHQNLLTLFSLVWTFCWWYNLHKIVSEKLNGFCYLWYVWFWASSNYFVLLKWKTFPYFLSAAVYFFKDSFRDTGGMPQMNRLAYHALCQLNLARWNMKQTHSLVWLHFAIRLNALICRTNAIPEGLLYQHSTYGQMDIQCTRIVHSQNFIA